MAFRGIAFVEIVLKAKPDPLKGLELTYDAAVFKLCFVGWHCESSAGQLSLTFQQLI